MKKKFLVLLVVILGLSSLSIIGYFKYKDLLFAPKTRLASGQYYPEMPPSNQYHYIDLLLDNNDSSKGSFVDFYKLSPSYDKSKNVIFVLTDGQQELVSPNKDFSFFEERLDGLSYVLIGVRGQYPNVFPEVYTKSGSLDLEKAMNLYSSQQQVEDIENVRKDMIQKGLLANDQKIMLYGGSGGGILVQQYLSKYGDDVSQAIIESSGTPDANFDNFSVMMKEYSPQTFDKFINILNTNMVSKNYLCWMLNRIAHDNLDYQELQIKLIDDISDSNYWSYYKYIMKPSYNYLIIKTMMKLPSEDAVRVRMFEMYGKGIINYEEVHNSPTNLAFEYSQDILKDFITETKNSKIKLTSFDYLKGARERYNGEVLVMSGIRDNVFNDSQVLSKAYNNSKRILFDDKHVLSRYPDYYSSIRKVFFTEGLHSQELIKLLNDSRQLVR